MSMDYKSLCKRNKLKRTAKPSTSIGKRTAYKYFQIRYNMEDKNDRTVLIYGNDEKVNPKYATCNKNVKPDQLVSGLNMKLPILSKAFKHMSWCSWTDKSVQKSQ